MNKIKKEVFSFFSTVSKISETVYLILFSLYVLVFLELKVVWKPNVSHAMDIIRYSLLGIIMWGSTLYLFYIIASWKNLWEKYFWLVFIGVCMLATTGYFSRKMSTNSYGVVFDIFFCLMAFGKSFRKMLKCIMDVTAIMLVIAGIGIPAGYTYDLGKPNVAYPGHSLGIDYPNTWAYLVFLFLMILWYLYLRKKPFFTFPIFWVCALFNWFYITCRTIAAVTFLFPFITLLVDWLEERDDKKVEEGAFKRNKPLAWVITLIPFIAFAFMMIVSMQVEWVHQFYHGPLRNLAWRFLMGGLYFRTYGIPIVGNPYRSNVQKFVNVNGEFIKVGILDSSFAAYIIMRGMFWMIYTLLWLCFALWKALKKRDYAIIFLEVVILGFAMMERPGLEMWFNFVLLYPLAKVASKPGTESVFKCFETTTDKEESELIDNSVDFELDNNDQVEIEGLDNNEVIGDDELNKEDSVAH